MRRSSLWSDVSLYFTAPILRLCWQSPLAIGIIFSPSVASGGGGERAAAEGGVLALGWSRWTEIFFNFIWNETLLWFCERTTKLGVHCSILRLFLPLQMIRKSILAVPHHCNFWAKIRVPSSCSQRYYGSIGGIFWQGRIRQSTMPYY